MNDSLKTIRESLLPTSFANGYENIEANYKQALNSYTNSQGSDTSATADANTDSEGSDLGSSNIINKPKLIISSYSLEPKIVEAGKDFNLSVTFYNTNNKNTIYNLKITLEQNLQAQPSDAGANNNLQSDGSVFSPVNSSNTFYEAVIYPRNTATKNIKMNVLPNAAAGNYVMGVRLEYEDYQGNQYDTTESIGIPVVQKAEIVTGDVNIDQAFANEPTSVSMNIYNTGKDKLTTFMCKVEGDGFTVDKDTQFIGNFNPGATETFSFNLTPTKEGPGKGKILLAYEDSTGKGHLEKKEFKFEAQASSENQAVDENGNPIDPQTGEIIDAVNPQGKPQGAIRSHLGLIIGGAAIIVLLIVFFRRRKKKKAEKAEEELNLDDQ